MRSLFLVTSIAFANLFLPISTGGECSTKCDKTAASCVDDCEKTHSGDPGPRIQCKVKCAEARQSCDKSCK